MLKLPLFPLNTVLFPGIPLSLHIFEDRYKLMISSCMQNQQPFGVVLIQSGTEALGPLAEPHKIGCTAKITQVQPLDDGGMNIVVVGQERFQILSLDYGQPYLMGNVELLPLSQDLPEKVTEASQKLRIWIERYLLVLSQADNTQFNIDQLPDDPVSLAYLAAFVLQIPPTQKQPLLTANGVADLLTNIRDIYRREVTLLNAILVKNKGDSEERNPPFSLN